MIRKASARWSATAAGCSRSSMPPPQRRRRSRTAAAATTTVDDDPTPGRRVAARAGTDAGRQEAHAGGSSDWLFADKAGVVMMTDARGVQRQGQARASVAPGAPELAARVRNDLSRGDGAPEFPADVDSSDGQEPESCAPGSITEAATAHGLDRQRLLGVARPALRPNSRRHRRGPRSCSARCQEAFWRCPVDHRGQLPSQGQGRQRECHSGDGCLVLRDTGHPRQRC